MSIYSNLKELYKDTNDIVNGKNIAWKIIYMLQNISFIIICMICLVDKCKIRTIIPENIEFGISQSVCDFLNKYIVICVIFYFGYLRYIGLYGGGKSHGNINPLSHFSHRVMQICRVLRPKWGATAAL